MIIAPLLLGWLTFAGGQRISQLFPETWSNIYPEIVNPRISETCFADNKEFRYLYDGQILTGIPDTANQFSGLRIRAIFTVQLRSGVDIFKIEKATLGRINERNILGGPLKIQPIQDFEELQGVEAQEWETALTKPIRFEYTAGAVTNLVSMESDPFWSVNIKRSILATFNLNLQKSVVASQQLGQKYVNEWEQSSTGGDNAEYFTVTEEGIGGECEATYVIQSLPSGIRNTILSTNVPLRGANVLNVTKTWDYSKCNNRPISFESLNNPVKCESDPESPVCNQNNDINDKDNIVDSAAHTRYNLIGSRNQYIIETAMTEAVHSFSPYSSDAGSLTAYVNASMKLIYAGAWSRDTGLPSGAGITLKGLKQLFPRFNTLQNDKYAFETDLANKPFLQSIGQWPNVAAKKVLVKILMERLVEDLADNEVETESANLVMQLSLVLKYATPEEILEIHQAVKTLSHQSFEHDQIQKLWMDVLALAGTKPAVLFIKREIATGNFVGERAAQVLNTLAFSIRKPDQDIVAQILDLCKSPSVATHSGLKKACWLSFGTLAHTSCVDDLETTTSIQNIVVKSGNPHCAPEGRLRFVMEIIARMRSLQNEEEQILLLKTLANTGFVEAVGELKAILSDDSRSVVIRSQAIYAFSHIAHTHPELTLTVLIPELFDVTNPFQVRIAAFDLILETKPELPDLEVIARSLQTERSIQVGSYIYSKLNAIANSTHPCYQQMAEDASLALEFAKPFDTGLSFSKGFHWGKYTENLELGGFAEVSMIADPSSIIPRGVNFRLNAHAFGLSHDLIEAGIETEGVNAVLKRLFMSRDDALFNPASVLDYLNEDDEIPSSNDLLSNSRQADASSLNYRRAARKPWNRPELDEIDQLLGITNRVDQAVKGSAYLKIFGQEVRFLTLTPKSLIKLVTDAYLRPSEMVGLVQGGLPVDYRKALMAADTEIMIPTELGLPLIIELKAPVVVSVKGTVGLKTVPSLSMTVLANIPHSVSIESDVTVSVASEIHGKMSVWAAFLKTGTGIVAKVSTTIPVDGALTLDIKTGKLQSSMNLPEEAVELINLEILPVTYTKLIPTVLAPHQPDRKDIFDQDRSQKIVQFNQQPLANELPTEFFSYKTSLMENPFMLSPNGRISSQYYRGLPIPILEYKEISTFDVLKTKLYSVHLGHPALGLLVDVQGHVQVPTGVPTAPMIPIGGKNKVIVTLKPFNAGLKTIDAALYVRQQQFSGVSKASWNTLYDKLVGYNTANILEQLSQNLPTGFAKNDRLGFSTQLIVRGSSGSSQDVAMQGVFSWVRGMDGKFVKVAGEFGSPHPQLSYEACLNGHAEYPSDYDSWTLTPGMNKPITGRFEVAFGRTCNSPDATKIRTTFVGDKSPQQITFEKNDYYSIEGSVIPNVISRSVEPLARAMKPVYQECEMNRKQGIRFSPACETVKDLYSSLMQMKIDIEYQNIPYGLEKLLTKAEHLLHSVYFWNSDINDVRVSNAPNKVTVLTDFTSADERVDVVYSTPHKDAKLLNIPVPYPLAPISADDEPMDIWEALLGDDLDDMCTVSGNELNTLDDARLRVPLSECYQLLAKDCSVEEAWSVLYAAAGSRYGEAKKVLAFIGEKKIEMIPAESVTSRYQTGSDMIIRVNGRTLSGARTSGQIMVDEEIEITVESQQGSYAPYYKISAEEYGLELWFDGHNVALKPTFWLRSQICGLCGNNNGEDWDDMLLPTGKIADSVSDLLRGYMVRKEGCGEELKSFARQQSLFPTSALNSECGKLRTIVKSRPGQVCFSVEPVATCSANCMEDDSSEEDYQLVKRVAFHCLQEDSALAQQLLLQVEARVLTEISQKQVNDYFVVASSDSCNSGNKGRRAGPGKSDMW